MVCDLDSGKDGLIIYIGYVCDWWMVVLLLIMVCLYEVRFLLWELLLLKLICGDGFVCFRFFGFKLSCFVFM